MIEIVELIEQHFARGIEQKYVDFARDNDAVCSAIAQRATSYWDEYHRARYPSRHTYPGLQVLQALKAAAAAGAAAEQPAR